MSHIDLKALRQQAVSAAERGIQGVVYMDPSNMLRLLDRLESAERRAEEAEKERDALVQSIPRNAEEMLAFIGSNYNAAEFRDRSGNPLPGEDVTYSITVHDLLSAFSDAELYDFELTSAAREGLVDKTSNLQGQQVDKAADSQGSDAQKGGHQTASEPVHYGVDAGDHGGHEVAQEGGK